MFRFGVIEESLFHPDCVKGLAPYLEASRVEDHEEDEAPVWHIGEYAVPESDFKKVMELLRGEIRPTWYIHAFDETRLFVIFTGRVFSLPEEWSEMVRYGTEVARVEPQYLQNITRTI